MRSGTLRRRIRRVVRRTLAERFSRKSGDSMIVNIRVLNESTREFSGKEWITITGPEESDKPLLQMMDYGLRQEESNLKGKLLGKVVQVQVENIRSVFSGRPQLVGRVVSHK